MWLSAFFKPSDKFDGVVRFASLHSAKGLEADSVWIINPSLTPLESRLAKGGWEEDEELCLAFMGRGRARRRLTYLPDLEHTSREEVLGLFQHTALEDEDYEELPSSQDTVTADEPGPDEQAAGSLKILGLKEMPTSTAELNVAVRTCLMRQSVDKETRAQVLLARGTVMALLT
jgi:hypothetical protein